MKSANWNDYWDATGYPIFKLKTVNQFNLTSISNGLNPTVDSIDSSKTMGHFPEVLNVNQLFLKTQRVNLSLAVGSLRSLLQYGVIGHVGMVL